MDDILLELTKVATQAREAGQNDAYAEITYLIRRGVLKVDLGKLKEESSKYLKALEAINRGLEKDQGPNHSSPSQQSGFSKS